MSKYTIVTLNAIALTSLLSTSINAYKPATNQELKNSVLEWCQDPIDTEGRKGARINDWDVSGITKMDSLFENENDCEPYIPGWDVSSVTSMSKMFQGATKFNSPLKDWDVSKVATMEFMFAQTDFFNQDIGSWDVRSVASMESMFWLATEFNQYLNDWDVKNVGRMNGMFENAYKFDQYLDEWDTSKVLTTEKDCSLVFYMFYNAGPAAPNTCNVKLLQTWRLWVKELQEPNCNTEASIFGEDCNDEDGDVYGTLSPDDNCNNKNHFITKKSVNKFNKEWKNEWKNKQKIKLQKQNKMKVKKGKNAKKNKSN